MQPSIFLVRSWNVQLTSLTNKQDEALKSEFSVSGLSETVDSKSNVKIVVVAVEVNTPDGFYFIITFTNITTTSYS